MKGSLFLLGCMAPFLVTSTASAAIVVTVGPGGGNPSENLHFNKPGLFTGPGLTIQGATNQSSCVLDILAAVNIGVQGQHVSAQSGNPFGSTVFIPHSANDLSANLNPMSGFLDFELNINASTDGTIYFVVEYSDLDGSKPDSFQSSSYFLDENGQNFFRIWTEAGEVIRKITQFPSGDIIDDIKQIRLSGLVTTDAEGNNIVIFNNLESPEPTSLAIWSLLALGLAGIAARRRRRQAE